VLHATASDANGSIISGLERSAFRLFVADQPHPITDFQGEDTPVAVGIVMDQSSSMADMRSVVIAAALAFSNVRPLLNSRTASGKKKANRWGCVLEMYQLLVVLSPFGLRKTRFEGRQSLAFPLSDSSIAQSS
jgi:hypothetical protein